MPRRTSTARWAVRHIRPSDGPDAGKRLRLEPWQRGVLRAVDNERRPIIGIRAAAQVGKTLLGLAVSLKAATAGRGVIAASATDVAVRDFGRRLDAAISASPDLDAQFPTVRTGPRALASWKDRRLKCGGWLGLASAGSASQLSARTVQVALADECARWPARTRNQESAPLQLLRARLLDWGEDGRLLAISSPIHKLDPINSLYLSGDMRGLRYPCPDCGQLTPLAWGQVVGRERGQVPMIACAQCGVLHDERRRRVMLRKGIWIPETTEPIDEDVISFGLSRLDSARSTLASMTAEFRRAKLATEQGDAAGLKAFRNLHCGLPSGDGTVDVDELATQRADRFDLGKLEQCTVGVDVQTDRLYYAVLGFSANNRDTWVLSVGACDGDPREPGVWSDLDAALNQKHGRGLRPSVVTVDAGYLTSSVKRECKRRRWWIPTVGRSQDGIPIARRIGVSGIAVLGKNDAASWWSGRVAVGRVHFRETLSIDDLTNLAAAEALTNEKGVLRWRPVPGRLNHLWDCALMAIHARHYRPTGAAPRRPVISIVRRTA